MFTFLVFFLLCRGEKRLAQIQIHLFLLFRFSCFVWLLIRVSFISMKHGDSVVIPS